MNIKKLKDAVNLQKKLDLKFMQDMDSTIRPLQFCLNLEKFKNLILVIS